MVQKWDVIVIGHPSRNPYWGEPRERRVRAPVCTCTLIVGSDYRLLVDPSYPDPERMAFELGRRSGLEPEDVDAVFVTHAHGDHTAGLRNFPAATWMAGPQVAEALNSSAGGSSRVENADQHLPEDVELVPSPGHAEAHYSLRFDCDGLSVVVAGDAIVAREFCRRGLSSFGTPTEQEKATVRKLRRMADAIVPGHGNWFLSGG